MYSVDSQLLKLMADASCCEPFRNGFADSGNCLDSLRIMESNLVVEHCLVAKDSHGSSTRLLIISVSLPHGRKRK